MEMPPNESAGEIKTWNPDSIEYQSLEGGRAGIKYSGLGTEPRDTKGRKRSDLNHLMR